jgi:hypothetical protein
MRLVFEGAGRVAALHVLVAVLEQGAIVMFCPLNFQVGLRQRAGEILPGIGFLVHAAAC